MDKRSPHHPNTQNTQKKDEKIIKKKIIVSFCVFLCIRMMWALFLFSLKGAKNGKTR